MNNIYEILTPEEREAVYRYSEKIHETKKNEPRWFRDRAVSLFALDMFRANHPKELEKVQKELEERKAAAYRRIERRRVRQLAS